MSNFSNLDEVTSDIDNERVKQLIKTHSNLKNLMSSPSRLTRHHQEMRDHEHNLNQYQERRWLIKKGKRYLIDFDNQERKKMKHYFNALDHRKTGSIGIDQLEELLFSVGLVESREEIKTLIESVDQKKTGRIDFADFLSIIQNDEGQNEEIVDFFKSVIGANPHDQKAKKKKSRIDPNNKGNRLKSTLQARESMFSKAGKTLPTASLTIHSSTKQGAGSILQKHPYPKGISFEMMVSHIRRKHMMTALNITQSSLHRAHSSQNTIEQIAKGQKVMQALQKMNERKLIRQIKENRRNSLAPSSPLLKKVKMDPKGLRITFDSHHVR